MDCHQLRKSHLTGRDLEGFPSSSAPTFRARNLVTYLAFDVFAFAQHNQSNTVLVYLWLWDMMGVLHSQTSINISNICWGVSNDHYMYYSFPRSSVVKHASTRAQSAHCHHQGTQFFSWPDAPRVRREFFFMTRCPSGPPGTSHHGSVAAGCSIDPQRIATRNRTGVFSDQKKWKYHETWQIWKDHWLSHIIHISWTYHIYNVCFNVTLLILSSRFCPATSVHVAGSGPLKA